MNWICKICDWKRESGPEGDWDTCPNCNAFEWMQEGERNDKKWTTAPPTEPGWYWVIANLPSCHTTAKGPHLVEVFYAFHDEFVTGEGLEVRWRDYSVSPSVFPYWLGPIPEPEPPV